MIKKNVMFGIAGMVAGILVGVVINFNVKTSEVINKINVCDYINDQHLEWAIGDMSFQDQLMWMNKALILNNDLVHTYERYEDAVNTYLNEIDSIYFNGNMVDSYPGYLQDAEDEVALQWAKADE